MKAGLTRTQWSLLNFIKGYIAQHGFSPSFLEMQAHLGLSSKSGVSRVVGALEQRGHITRIKFAHGSIGIVPDTLPGGSGEVAVSHVTSPVSS